MTALFKYEPKCLDQYGSVLGLLGLYFLQLPGKQQFFYALSHYKNNVNDLGFYAEKRYTEIQGFE